MSKKSAFQHEFRSDLVKEIVAQVRMGETLALIGIPGVGKTNILHWIKKRSKEKNSIININLDLNNLVSSDNLAFYRLFLLEIYRSASQTFDIPEVKEIKEIYKENIAKRDSLLTFDAIKQIINIILDKTDYRICCILDCFEKLKDMDPSIFSSLLALRSLDKTRIIYLFSGNTNLASIFQPSKLGDFYSLLSYNKHWIRPLTKKETYLLIDEFADILDANINEKQKKRIWELAGGHSWYIKILTKLFSEQIISMDSSLPEIFSLSNIQSRAVQIWSALEENVQQNLIKLINGNNIKYENLDEYTKKTNLVTKNKEGKLQIFSPIFRAFVKQEKVKRQEKTEPARSSKFVTLELEPAKKDILRNNSRLKETFTKKEIDLLEFFFDNESVVVSRDDIAEIMWKKDYIEKYSDWAIDKTISRLRRKIELDPTKPRHLKTRRGVGFTFESKVPKE